MPFCPQCRGEFENWVTECPDCRVPMVDELPPLPSLPPPPSKTARKIRELRESPVIVYKSYFPMEAHIIAGRLESEGIPAFVTDEHMVNANWMYVNAINGIRVLVRAEDAVRARKILGTEPPEEAVPTTAETCPRCHSPHIRYETFSLRPVFLSWIITYVISAFIFPFLKRKWKCKDCGYQWKEKKKRQADADTNIPVES